MKKLILILAGQLFFSMYCLAQIEQYGPFIGGNAFVYKSNLYNSLDLAADSVQKYKITMGFSGGFDFGYRYENGISISSGISFGTSNQKYSSKDTIIGNVVELNATTKLSFIKIPLIVSMQTRNDKPLKAFYSIGLYYGYNAGFSESIAWDYKYNTVVKDYTTTIKDHTIETVFVGDSNKYSSDVDQRPYQRHAWGAILGLGASKRLNDKMEGYVQAKIEYQISSVENTSEMVFTPNIGSKEEKRVGRVWGNYAKYMHNAKANYNRPATHPFNLGITFGIRYFLFDFE